MAVDRPRRRTPQRSFWSELGALFVLLYSIGRAALTRAIPARERPGAAPAHEPIAAVPASQAPSRGTLWRRVAGLGALALLLLALWRTAPPVPAMATSKDVPAVQHTETMEGVVLSTQLLSPAPAAGSVDSGQPTPSAAPDASVAPPVQVVVRLTSGSQRGREVPIVVGGGAVPNLSSAARSYAPGDKVVVSYVPDLESSAANGGAPAGAAAQSGEAGQPAFELVDHVRWPWLIWGAALFAIVVVAVARGQGARALVGLSVAVCVLWWFVIPRLLVGQPPVPIALTGCALIAIPALMLTNGIGRASLVPLGGIAGSLLAVGVLAAAAVQVTHLTGLSTSEELSLVYVGTQGAIDPRGLLLAGMVIGAVGGLVDVTVGQSAAVFEFHEADPSAPRAELFRRGMNVGRAHVAAAVHTLILAYAGAALPLLLLFAMNAAVLGTIWNRELIVAEVLRSVTGSIGLAAAMPLTTLLACLTCRS